MGKEISNEKYLTFEIQDTTKLLADVKDYIRKQECSELAIDIEKLNIMDAAKIIVMVSTYHTRKYPDGKLICKTQSAIKNLLSTFSTKNLEFVI